MDIIELSEEIINGRRLKPDENHEFLISADLEQLCKGADMIRRKFSGKRADLCSIINGRSGKCSENCKFCAQSAHNCTNIKEYGYLDSEKILEECKYNEARGVDRFAIVTAGRTVSGKDFEKTLETFRLLSEECNIKLCASHGLLTQEQFFELRKAGVSRYHANIETSRRNFPNICTSHTFDDKIECIKRAKAAGFEVCSGGIIGMGENWEDRIDMAFTLAELEINSIPINALMPIKGTPLENYEPLSEEDILRTVAIFRYIIPTASIRLAAGRNLMKNCGEKAFLSGADSTITGDMLTTSGNKISDDIAMLKKMGFELKA